MKPPPKRRLLHVQFELTLTAETVRVRPVAPPRLTVPPPKRDSAEIKWQAAIL